MEWELNKFWKDEWMDKWKALLALEFASCATLTLYPFILLSQLVYNK